MCVVLTLLSSHVIHCLYCTVSSLNISSNATLLFALFISVLAILSASYPFSWLNFFCSFSATCFVPIPSVSLVFSISLISLFILCVTNSVLFSIFVCNNVFVAFFGFFTGFDSIVFDRSCLFSLISFFTFLLGFILYIFSSFGLIFVCSNVFINLYAVLSCPSCFFFCFSFICFICFIAVFLVFSWYFSCNSL